MAYPYEPAAIEAKWQQTWLDAGLEMPFACPPRMRRSLLGNSVFARSTGDAITRPIQKLF